MVSDLDDAPTTLEQEWSEVAEEVVAWLLARPGWIEVRGAVEFLPSRPPCLITVNPPMGMPCRGTLIDATELSVFPPRVEYCLDGSEDMDDYSSTSWRYAAVPTEFEITGRSGIPLTTPVVTSVDFIEHGDGMPDEIRKSIDIIESAVAVGRVWGRLSVLADRMIR